MRDQSGLCANENRVAHKLRQPEENLADLGLQFSTEPAAYFEAGWTEEASVFGAMECLRLHL